jgi:transglutaminase-like putative cysteine protease
MSEGYTEAHLAPGRFVDSDHPDIKAYAKRIVDGETDTVRAMCKIYYAVRDDFRYDPYNVDYDPESFTASATLNRGYGFCVTKGGLLAALARAIGVPSRLGYADVKNHLTTDKLKESMKGSDLFVFHGYTDLFLNGKWVKATPAFNISLCEKFGILPLEFDGTEDSIFHPYDASGQRHMEYVNDRGVRDDVPFDEIMRTFMEAYPGFEERNEVRKTDGKGAGGSFEVDAKPIG